jgi:4-nitrophenyl phosphatase
MDFSAAIVDLDGTVYRGGDAVPGAPEAVAALRDAGLDPLFLSNNPTKTPAAYVERLAGMDIAADESEVLSAGAVTTAYLQDEHGDDAVFPIASPGLREQLDDGGLSLVDDPTGAEVVVASWKRDFDYDDMRDALVALDDDTAFIGSDPDRTIPTGDGMAVPGSGAIIGSVGVVTDRDPDIVLGKPADRTTGMALDRLGVPAGECLLVGDNLDTDIAMGENAGMETVLVLSGASTRADIEAADATPDHVMDALSAVPDALL